MAYVENLLATGEQLLRREHQHWFVLIANAVYAILGWILAAILLWISTAFFGDGGLVATVLGWAVVVLIIGGLLWFAWQALRWRNEEFVVTTRRVLQVEGVVNKRVSDSSLEKINDAILTESIFGRMFGFGDLEILTASETGISRLHMLREADGFKRTMLDAKHDLELELSGARPMPAPAFRAPPASALTGVDPATAGAATGGAATAGAAAAGVPGPGAAAAPTVPSSAPTSMSADDVTRTLASLADLRDRGAISAEEYETKKGDLLSRL